MSERSREKVKRTFRENSGVSESEMGKKRREKTRSEMKNIANGEVSDGRR